MTTDALNRAEKLLHALARGAIRGIGHTIYDYKMDFLMTNTDLFHAIRELASRGFKIERVDSGGSPKWELIQ